MSMEYSGLEEIPASPKAAVLNSRQSKYPVGTDQWISATGKIVTYLAERDFVLVTSLGMNTWELALTFAARLQMRVIVVVPESVIDRGLFTNDICRRFHLHPAKTGFYFMTEQPGKTAKASWAGRDTAVVDLADRLFPVSIRPKGQLAALIEANPKKVDSSFSVPYNGTTRLRPKYDVTDLNPAVDWSRWLIHFTRSSSGPWPDETEFDFYSDMFESTGEFCRSAGRTLRHIAGAGTIYGHSKKIRGGHAVVPFTLITPDSIKYLFRYRSRFVNPGLEPYGIAIAKDSAVALGIRPVIYGTSDAYTKLAENDKPYFQHQGSYGAQWTIENEWRHLGDFQLDRLSADRVRIIVPTLDAFPDPENPLPSPAIPLLLSPASARSMMG